MVNRASGDLFDSALWDPALRKFSEVTGLSVELFSREARVIQPTMHAVPLVRLFQKHGFDPGLFTECARRCLLQATDRPAIVVSESHGLTVIGTSLVLEGAIVGAAVAGYAFAGFAQVNAIHRWADSAGVPFESLWSIAREQSPIPEHRLRLHGELLQILGDTILRENYRIRQYEDAVLKLEAAAAAKEGFLAMVSHELRTPLSPILGWAGMLKKNPNLEQVRRAAAAIERNALHMTRMVDDLLTVNVATRGMIQLDLIIVELSTVIRAALETHAPDIEKKGIRLSIIETSEALYVEADVDRLQQVFGNILSNALKFTPVDGEIRVTTVRETDSARITIADTGAGIAAEYLPLVFDMFQQQESGPRRLYPGLGIGLALVKQFTEMHKGSVGIDSAGRGGGTEVNVRLPLVAAPGTRKPGGAPLPALAGLSVLVVDNVEACRETLRLLLQDLGARVSVAHSAREGLDMLREIAPDLVLCNLHMPQMDGIEFIRELRRDATATHAPVLAVCAPAGDADRQRTREAGFVGHIEQPFEETAIIAAMEAALHGTSHFGHAQAAGAVVGN